VKSCSGSRIFWDGKVRGVRARKRGARMASHGRELLGGHYDDEHLTYEEIRELGLKVVTEKGETIPIEDLRGKIFRMADRDDASGYVVSNMESTGTGTVLCYLQAS
jgi:hypothetical protein